MNLEQIIHRNRKIEKTPVINFTDPGVIDGSTGKKPKKPKKRHDVINELIPKRNYLHESGLTFITILNYQLLFKNKKSVNDFRLKKNHVLQFRFIHCNLKFS